MESFSWSLLPGRIAVIVDSYSQQQNTMETVTQGVADKVRRKERGWMRIDTPSDVRGATHVLHPFSCRETHKQYIPNTEINEIYECGLQSCEHV